MTVNQVMLFDSPGVPSASTEPLERIADRRLLNLDQKGGIQFLWDAAYRKSYSGASPVGNGDAFGNMAKDEFFDHASSATMVVASGQTVAFNKGIDLSALTTSGSYLQLPDEFSSVVYASANQYFAVTLVLKLPEEAQWNSTTSQAPIYTHSTANNGDIGAPGLISVVLRTQAGNKLIQVNRQLTYAGSSGTMEQIPLTVPTGSPAFGKVCMVTYRRTAAGQKLTLFYFSTVNFTASVTKDVMTVTSPPSGASLTVGAPVRGDGIPTGTTILELGTGTGGNGTYVLSQAVASPIASSTLLLPLSANISVTAAVGSKNTNTTFFNTRAMVGLCNTQWSNAILTAGGGNIRIHRIWTDASEVSGLDPDVVAAADWQRVLIRNEF